MELNFQTVEKCPACGSQNHESLGHVGFGEIHYNAVRIPNPCIKVLECQMCGLIFKNKMLGWEAIGQLYREGAPETTKRWSYRYDYSEELNLILKFAGGVESLLDIGCNDCSFLRLARRHFRIVSGIDVSHNLECDGVINGEYLVFPIDLPLPDGPKRNKYDVVTLYDVIEHVVDIERLISNCYEALSPGGVLVVETGDYENELALRYGPSRWWYMNLLEHQVCFSKSSMKRFLESNGFQILFMENKIHKSNINMRLSVRLSNFFQRSVYGVMGHWIYSRTFHFLGRRGQQPRNTGLADQLSVIARKRQ